MSYTNYNLPALSNEGGLSAYLAQIKKFPMLDAEEEYMLAKNWRENGNLKSAHKLVTSHLRLVAKIAMGYRGFGLPVTTSDGTLAFLFNAIHSLAFFILLCVALDPLPTGDALTSIVWGFAGDFTLDKFAFGIFLSIVFIAILIERNNLLNYFDDIGVVVIILISSIFITVFIITKIFINDLGSRRAILIEGLLQNGAMGFIVGAQLFHEIEYITPIAIYALIQYVALMFYIGNININKITTK